MISVQSHIEHNPPLNLEDFWALYELNERVAEEPFALKLKDCWRESHALEIPVNSLSLKTKRLLNSIPCPWNTGQQSLP